MRVKHVAQPLFLWRKGRDGVQAGDKALENECLPTPKFQLVTSNLKSTSLGVKNVPNHNNNYINT